jgi:hypothetical protein
MSRPLNGPLPPLANVEVEPASSRTTRAKLFAGTIRAARVTEVSRLAIGIERRIMLELTEVNKL